MNALAPDGVNSKIGIELDRVLGHHREIARSLVRIKECLRLINLVDVLPSGANDRDAVRNALVAAGVEAAADARVVRIKNTLHIDSMVVSLAALASMRNAARYRIGGESDGLALHSGVDFAAYPTARNEVYAQS